MYDTRDVNGRSFGLDNLGQQMWVRTWFWGSRISTTQNLVIQKYYDGIHDVLPLSLAVAVQCLTS